MLGEIDDGGLMRVRVSGLTIGIGFRDRIADGWWSLRLWFIAKFDGGEVNAECVDDGRDKAGASCGWIWCCTGELSGEPLDRDDRSEEPEVTDCRCKLSVRVSREAKSSGQHTSSQVKRLGQNSMSSSRSKERPASKRALKTASAGGSLEMTFSAAFIACDCWCCC